MFSLEDRHNNLIVRSFLDLSTGKLNRDPINSSKNHPLVLMMGVVSNEKGLMVGYIIKIELFGR